MKHVVIALIFKNHKLCVGRRLSDPFESFIECPGGKIEDHESLTDALKREMFEELELVHYDQTYPSFFDVHNMYGAFKLHFF